MTKSSSVSGAGHVLATRYANSLIEVASQAGAIASVEKDMASLQKALSESKELQVLLNNPVYSKEQQLNVIQDIARKASCHALTINFMGVLAHNGRLNALSNIMTAFFKEMERRHGIMEAQVVSACALTEAQQQTLAQTLSAKTSKKIKLSMTVDPTLLGGMVVTVGSKMIDDSIKTRLQQLKNEMIGSKAA